MIVGAIRWMSPTRAVYLPEGAIGAPLPSANHPSAKSPAEAELSRWVMRGAEPGVT